MYLTVDRKPQLSPPVFTTPARVPLLQRQCACGQHADGGECESCRKKRVGTLQRSAANTSPANQVPPVVHEVLRAPGQPLDAASRADLEPRFGHDFSQVRVHTGAQAADSTKAVHAFAYTVGKDIVFGAGQYAPGTFSGRRLLAHELTHVIQQSGNPFVAGQRQGLAESQEGISVGTVPEGECTRMAPRLQPKLIVGQAGDRYEHEADLMAHQMISSPEFGTECRIPSMRLSAVPVRLQRAPADLTARATYPSEEQRRQIQSILNPQQERAAAAGGVVPAVSDEPGFRSEMKECAIRQIDREVPQARARESSSVRLGEPAIVSLAEVTQREVQNFYSSYLRAAVHSPAERSRIEGYRLREHLHLLPDNIDLLGTVDEVAKSLLSNRMLLGCAGILQTYNVLVGSGARDQALFESVRDEVFAERTSDVRAMARFNPGFQSGGEVFIQTHLPQREGESEEDSEIRGRWKILGTTIHEMLHAVAHQNFRDAVRPLEERDIGIEGFAEFFTRPVFEAIVARARDDAALRASIEGRARPFHSELISSRTSYQPYYEAVKTEISDKILKGNEENLKVAYFMGKVEYIGLGGWNAAEAARRHPANQLGAAILLLQGDGGQAQAGFRVRYSRVVLGRAGNLQLRLGGDINYLSSGNRLGLGGNASLQYSWPNVYLRGGVSAGASASVGQPLERTIRLDVIPEIEAGVRIGIVRVGAGATLLIPVAGGPVDERALRWGAFAGASIEF